jgi:hypothetical protein
MASGALAHGSLDPGGAFDLPAMTSESNLVALGQVVDVQYRNASVKGSNAVVPHAFVTFQVQKVVRGKPASQNIVMRFVGGVDGMGGILDVSGVPMFQKGETDVLFIAGNGEAACPLARCEWGRFRVLNGAVYNTHGAPVLELTKDDHVVAKGRAPEALTTISFPTPTFDNLLKNPVAEKKLAETGMSYEQAKARYDQESPKELVVKAVRNETSETSDPVDQAAPPAQQLKQLPKAILKPALKNLGASPAASQKAPMKVEQFLAQVSRIAAQSKRKPIAIKNADAKAELIVPAFTQAGPPPYAAVPPSQDDPALLKETQDPLGLEQKGLQPQ